MDKASKLIQAASRLFEKLEKNIIDIELDQECPWCTLKPTGWLGVEHQKNCSMNNWYTRALKFLSIDKGKQK